MPRLTAVLGISPDILLITSRVFSGAEESNDTTSAITGAPFSPTNVSHFKLDTRLGVKKFGKYIGFTWREFKRALMFFLFTCLIKLLSINQL